MDISSMLEVQVKEETDVKENVTPGQDQASNASSTATSAISQDESNYYKIMLGNDIASVRFRRLHCTACDVHIGSAPAQAHNMFEHPVIRTLLCSSCYEFYGDGRFEQGDDATDMFCRWCANGGNLYCCSYCSNTFCNKCIRRNFTSLVRKKIEADEKWKCFVCKPNDLYSLRAVCWALLQHVQTVTRILAHDKKMSAEEIEQKMNLDESQCCPRRSKRKRRRPDSNSEEEDETYTPKANGGVTSYVKRKPLKRYKAVVQPATNGTRVQSYKSPIPIRPRPVAFPRGQCFNEPSNSAVNRENSPRNPKDISLPSSSVTKSNTQLPSRFDPSVLPQQHPPPLYRTSFVNTSGSATYIQTPVPMSSTTRIILPPQPQPQSQSQSQSQSTQLTPYQSLQNSYQAQQTTSYQPQPTSSYQPQPTSSYQPQPTSSYQSQPTSSYQSPQLLQSTPNTMVSIPNPVDKLGRPVFLLPKPKEVDITPNIIELDSDSDDEPNVVLQNNSTTNGGNSMNVSTTANRVVPVALTWENSDDDVVREEQPLREVCVTEEKDRSFKEIMLPHSQELDKVLSDTKGKMYNLFNLSNAIKDIKEAEQIIKQFHCTMRGTVFQLVQINDRIVRQYIGWSRPWETETKASPSIDENASVSQENVDIPLDMICVNDSDTESEDCENQIREPSDLIKDSDIIKNLLLRKANVVHRSVGDDNVHLTMDKAIQVYDTVLRDYEDSIGYSVVTTDQNREADESASNLPIESDKNFGKYEEQFIFYLQRIKDEDQEAENMRGVDSDEMSLQEVVQTDPSFISDLLQDVDLSMASSDQLENCQEENLSDIDLVTKDDENNTLVKNNEEIVNNSDTEKLEMSMQLDGKLQQTESQKTCAETLDEETTTSDNTKTENDNIINMDIINPVGSEEDCTIIDN